MARTIDGLRQMQALPLDLKIRMSETRIRQWVDEFGEDGVYISFSGGKDSTVLLHLVRELYPNVPAVFCDTGLEYPEIREFVKTFDNVEWLKPKMNFRKVVETYGYPFISKEVSENIYSSIIWLKKQNCKQPYSENAESLKMNGMPHRLARILGIYEKNWGIKKKDGKFNCSERSAPSLQQNKYKFLLDAPFLIGSNCCNIMKKNPTKQYAKQTGRHPMTGQTASESRLRTSQWLKHGCNGFNMEHPISNPMSFWTEQDVLLYIKKNNIKIASVYGDIVQDEEKSELPEGQMCFMSDEHIMLGKSGELLETSCVLKTTGCKRTGCMFCGYGCHLEKEGEGRFERMKETHPKQYEWIMKPWAEGGLGYKDVIDWLNENGGLNIKY